MRRAVERAGLAGRIEVDSAGTSAEHAGDRPDRRAVAEANRRGLDLRDQRARKVRPDDWDRFDLLLVADGAVERALLRAAPDDAPDPRSTASPTSAPMPISARCPTRTTAAPTGSSRSTTCSNAPATG